MNAKKFVEQWTGHGYEKGEAQSFWLTLLRDLFDVDEPEKIIRFEVPVSNGFIDALIEDTNTLIEQKSSNVKLDDPEIFLQAKRYDNELEYSRKARRIITCNFKEFRVFDMDKKYPEKNPLIIPLEDLPNNYHALDFLIDPYKIKERLEKKLSLEAGRIVAKIYNELLKTLAPGSSEKNLNILCVRIIFCLYAESVDIFGKHKNFRDYLLNENNIRRALRELFQVLNTPIEMRSPYLDDALKNFPYVNGGLFADEIDFPNFTPELRELLLEEASSNFNWEGISPTIFGTVFESTLNPETRREGGMHYTDVENIRKVINPLFMDDLREEFSSLKTKKQFRDFQDKLASIKVFDPACGSGNFLTESYLSLRRLENEVLKALLGSQIQLGELDDPIKVSIQNFYGIELNDFAVTVAKTSMWIAELKMKKETAAIVHKDLKNFPLKEFENIHEGNALRIDWKKLFEGSSELGNEGSRSTATSLFPYCSNSLPNYIIGNPPFVGKSFQTPAQKADMANIFKGIKNFGNLDYVACWYKKAADFIQGTKIQCAFVSTNSISQGIAVEPLWEYLFGKGVVINFVHQTFKWFSESSDKAAVHCVVVGFATFDAPIKRIFNGNSVRVVNFINAYLIDGANVIIKPKADPPKGIPPMFVGANPTDGGNLILSADERDELIKKNPLATKYIHTFLSGEDFIKGKVRYCLWLKDCPPNELRQMPRVMKRVEAVRDFRLASKSLEINRYAKVPTLFARTRYIEAPKIVIPRHSSSNRQYIPMGFVESEVVLNDGALFIANAELFHFGVLTSSIHMAWMRIAGGRIGNGYRYGRDLVYNTFCWCEYSSKIEETAQNILDVRAKYPDATLADLYDELSMPKDLREAHKKNDRAVAKAYGFSDILDDEPAIVARLMKLYEGVREKG
ncbi:MAG: class I SAM-dependent DNA methyltransferase [Selenomonadaceae bacterium]|nr:class I SAM-dependent DNA methyltransferase [Selenomonadaceae bacterium]